jgi:predicted nucleic acid-binding protein
LEELASLGETARNLNLDFDDAYQYVLAQRRGLRLVSFDADFDRTPLGRVTPAQALGN